MGAVLRDLLHQRPEEQIQVTGLPVDVQGRHFGIRAAFEHLEQGPTVGPFVLTCLTLRSVHTTSR